MDANTTVAAYQTKEQAYPSRCGAEGGRTPKKVLIKLLSEGYRAIGGIAAIVSWSCAIARH